MTSAGVAAAIGLAGCGDAVDGGDDTPFGDADWRDADGLDVETLATRHVETAVEAGGVTLFSTAETTHEAETEPSPWLPSQVYESRYDLENERQYLRQEMTGTDEVDRYEMYREADTALIREQIGTEVGYGRRSTDGESVESVTRADAVIGIRVPQGTGAETYEGLNNWRPTPDGADEVDGERTARFVSESFEGERPVPETIATASAAVDVFESGFVPRIEQSWEGPHDGTTATVDVGIEYRDRGVTVAEPEWVEEARAEAGE